MEAYNTAKYAAKNCIRLSDFENAKKWLNRMIEVNNNLHQSDEELKFYIGMYLFETGDFKEALDKFQFVVKRQSLKVSSYKSGQVANSFFRTVLIIQPYSSTR